MKKAILAAAIIATSTSAMGHGIRNTTPVSTIECEVYDYNQNTIGKGTISYDLHVGEVTAITSYQFELPQLLGVDYNEKNQRVGEAYKKDVTIKGNGDDFYSHKAFATTNDLFNPRNYQADNLMIFMKTGLYYNQLRLTNVSLNEYGTDIGHIVGRVYQSGYGSQSRFASSVATYIECGHNITSEEITTARRDAQAPYISTLHELEDMSAQYVKDIELQGKIIHDQEEYITLMAGKLSQKDAVIVNYTNIISDLSNKIENWKNIVNALTAELNVLRAKMDAALNAQTEANQQQIDNLMQTIQWQQRENALLNQENAALKATLKNKDKAAENKDKAAENVQRLEVETPAEEVASPSRLKHEGGSGSMGLGLALLGIFGAARRFKK